MCAIEVIKTSKLFFFHNQKCAMVFCGLSSFRWYKSTSGFSLLLVAVPPPVSEDRTGMALLALSCADAVGFIMLST